MSFFLQIFIGLWMRLVVYALFRIIGELQEANQNVGRNGARGGS